VFNGPHQAGGRPEAQRGAAEVRGAVPLERVRRREVRRAKQPQEGRHRLRVRPAQPAERRGAPRRIGPDPPPLPPSAPSSDGDNDRRKVSKLDGLVLLITPGEVVAPTHPMRIRVAVIEPLKEVVASETVAFGKVNRIAKSGIKGVRLGTVT